MSTAVRPSTLTRKPGVLRCGGKNTTARGKSVLEASVTAQPSHVHGDPQPQP